MSMCVYGETLKICKQDPFHLRMGWGVSKQPYFPGSSSAPTGQCPPENLPCKDVPSGKSLRQVGSALSSNRFGSFSPASFLSYSFIAIAALFINIDFGWMAWLPIRYFALISQMTCDAALSWYHPAVSHGFKARGCTPKSCIREVSFPFHLLAPAFLLSQYLPFPFLSRPLFPFPPLPGFGKPVPP